MTRHELSIRSRRAASPRDTSHELAVICAVPCRTTPADGDVLRRRGMRRGRPDTADRGGRLWSDPGPRDWGWSVTRQNRNLTQTADPYDTFVRFERCRLVFVPSLAKHIRFASTNPSGCSAVVAHVLWEPLGPVRRRVGVPERGGPSGEGTDYCAVREHESEAEAPALGSCQSGRFSWM
jgi:hypothetical protein